MKAWGQDGRRYCTLRKYCVSMFPEPLVISLSLMSVHVLVSIFLIFLLLFTWLTPIHSIKLSSGTTLSWSLFACSALTLLLPILHVLTSVTACGRLIINMSPVFHLSLTLCKHFAIELCSLIRGGISFPHLLAWAGLVTFSGRKKVVWVVMCLVSA